MPRRCRDAQHKVLLVVGLALAPALACACTCSAPATPAEGLQRSSAVFTGTLVRIDRPFWDAIGLTKSGNHRVRFEVIKRWKGRGARNVDLVTRLSSEGCGYAFVKGERYLVYVAPGPSGIQTGICTGTKRTSEAEREMEALDRLVPAGETR